MKPSRDVYLIGAHNTPFIGKFHPDFIWKKHPDFETKKNPTLQEYLATAALGALEDANLKPADVQKGFVGNFVGELFSNQGHLGSVLASAHPDFYGKPFSRVEGACASGALALVNGIDAISAGYDVVLVAGAEVQTTVNAKIGADYLARASHYETQRELDPFTFPALFARRTKAYVDAFGIEEADIAKVVVNAYSNAAKNPLSHMGTVTMTLEKASEASDKNPTFLTNEELKPYIKISDCSQVSDGGSAVILVSAEGLAKAGKTPADAVRIVSYGHATGPIEGPSDLTQMDVTKLAGEEAYASAGVTPDQIQVAEVHDCFAIAQILAMEALGFASGPGKAKEELIDTDAFALDGKIPINTGGGLMAFGHPVGATGVKQAGEIFRQLLGRCGEYQVPGEPTIGLTQNMGGDDRTAVVTILKRG
ncbi:MAG: propanoyl-CoA acyltransferase [Planctomycetes bacterium]|nr:propanoyl-CoA acyltransferase [Planctomycetota bacterium]